MNKFRDPGAVLTEPVVRHTEHFPNGLPSGRSILGHLEYRCPEGTARRTGGPVVVGRFARPCPLFGLLVEMDRGQPANRCWAGLCTESQGQRGSTLRSPAAPSRRGSAGRRRGCRPSPPSQDRVTRVRLGCCVRADHGAVLQVARIHHELALPITRFCRWFHLPALTATGYRCQFNAPGFCAIGRGLFRGTSGATSSRATGGSPINARSWRQGKRFYCVHGHSPWLVVLRRHQAASLVNTA